MSEYNCEVLGCEIQSNNNLWVCPTCNLLYCDDCAEESFFSCGVCEPPELKCVREAKIKK